MIRFSSNTFGGHCIEERDNETDKVTKSVHINTVEVAKDKEQLREVLNGMANLLTSLACHLK